jgi:[ribosomal protein S5]-alanine N-acetyltransferase
VIFATDAKPKISLATRLETERLVLRPAQPSDIPLLYRALRHNADYLRPFSPAAPMADRRPTLALATREMERWRALWKSGESYALFCFLRGHEKGESARIVGRVTLGRVTRGAFLNSYLGYFVDRDEQGKGITSEAVCCALDFAFGPLGLHRVQAAIMPRNLPSLRVAEKCGFRREGHALRYLQIAGAWEDHDIFAMTSEEWLKNSAK